MNTHENPTLDGIIVLVLAELKKVIKNTSIDIQSDTQLISENLLDSMDLLSCVSWMESKFGITMDPEYLVPENFESPRAISQLVLGLVNDESRKAH